MEVFRYARCALVNMSITLIQRSAPWGSVFVSKRKTRGKEEVNKRQNDNKTRKNWRQKSLKVTHRSKKKKNARIPVKWYVLDLSNTFTWNFFELTWTSKTQRKRGHNVIKMIGNCVRARTIITPKTSTDSKQTKKNTNKTHTRSTKISYQMRRHGLGDGPGHGALVVALQVKVHQTRFAGENQHAGFDGQALALGHKGMHHRNLRLGFLHNKKKQCEM